MTVFIVGNGIVGQRVARMLDGHPVEFHDPRREPTPAAVAGDVAVLAHPVEHCAFARAFGLRGASVVTVGDDIDDTYELLTLDNLFESAQATLAIGAGMSPGLSGLVARHLVDQLKSVDEIHVAIHGTAGPACARTHHQSLSRRAPGLHDGQWVEYLGGSGRELCWFPEPVGAKDCYRADISDPMLLHAAFPGARRISARRSATRRDRLTARLPMLSPPHQEGGIGALRVEVRGVDHAGGRACLIAGVAELVGTATAAMAAAMTMAILEGRLPTGTAIAGSPVMPTLHLLHGVESYGVRIQEFTGLAQSR